MTPKNEALVLSPVARRSAERLRASLERLNDVTRDRLDERRSELERKSKEILDTFMRAEAWFLIAFAFGLGIFLGRRRH